MKNKKGFTLVEIIITLAIVITITTVAIGSYIGISDKKKKEEWRLVKDQIETAAEQYFSSNKYLYEGLTDDVKAYISVGTLVNKDYLNKVVDPMTGNQVSYCSEIQVSFKDGKYKGTYIGTRSGESKSDCSDEESQVVIRNPDGPKGDITYHKYNDDNKPNFENDITKNGWFNIEKLGGTNKNLAVCVNLTKGGKNIASATLNGKDLTKYSNNNKNIYCANIENGQYNNQQFILKDSLGKTLKIIDSYNVDSTYPEGKIYLTSTGNGYNSNVVNAISRAKDTYSGVANIIIKAIDGDKEGTLVDDTTDGYQKKLEKNSIKIANSLDGITHTMKSVITDAAGNSKEIESDPYKVYLLCSETYVKSTETHWKNNCSNKCGGGTETGDIYENRNDKYITNNYCSTVDSGTDNSRSCGGTVVKSTTPGSYGSCSDICGGKKYRTVTANLVSSIDSSYSCGTSTYDEPADCGGKKYVNKTYGSWKGCSLTCTARNNSNGDTIHCTNYRDVYNHYVAKSDSKHTCPSVKVTDGDSKTESKTCESPCDNMDKYVSISSSSHQTKNKATKSYPTYKSGNQTYVDFTFTITNSKISKVATHAAFCRDYDTCKDVNSSNKNQTRVWCNERYNCYSGWQYVGASITLSCGGKEATYHYAHQIGTRKTWFDY